MYFRILSEKLQLSDFIIIVTRRGGHTKEPYEKGDTLNPYLNPTNPEEIIDKASLKNLY
jgi:hypothetical protein